MKISTKARYGLRALVDLALHQSEGPVGLKEIAEREGVSEKYLEHLFRQLKAANLVRSTRGASGGYELARSPEKINLLEVVEALEGGVHLVDCIDQAELCPRVPQCVTREVWEDLKNLMEEYLKSKNLSHLARRQKEKWSAPVYYI